MKREITEFRTGSFIDFAGKERKFIVCALSSTPERTYVYNDDSPLEFKVVRSVSIGVSICNPVDKYDEKIGMKIAENKARNPEHALSVIYTPSNGAVNTELVDAYLKQEIKFIVEHPELVFAGYYSAKLRYDKEIEFDSLYQKANEATTKAYDALSDDKVDVNVLNKLLEM